MKVETQKNWVDDRNIRSFSHLAMATHFEIYIADETDEYAVQAAHAAYERLDLLEQELSRFLENSDISRINTLQKNDSTIVSRDTFDCLKQCQQLHIDTKKAFDPAIGGYLTDRIVLNYADISSLFLDDSSGTVRLCADGISIDLGGYGKGYAIDRISDLLNEWEIKCFLIHGGYSTVKAGLPPQREPGWPLSVTHPLNPKQLIKKLYLNNCSLSSSGLKKGPHIIDPRKKITVAKQQAAWVKTKSAAVSDALSTAFMIMELKEISAFIREKAGISALIVEADGKTYQFGTDL